jgi:UDP-N-acetylglucosamine acyltransferase
MMLHPTAIVDSQARVHPSVQVGPFCVIGPEVSIDEGCVLHSHVVITGHTTVGKNNTFFPFTSIGHRTQDIKHKGGPVQVVIGDGNIFRENVTVNQGADYDVGITKIGNNNLFMACSHVAHDCDVHNNCILANSVALAGHVVLEDYVIVGGLSGIYQYCRIGRNAIVGATSGVYKDVIPFGSVYGSRAELEGLNWIGLKRKGFTKEQIQSLRRAYNDVFHGAGVFADRLKQARQDFADDEFVISLIDFIEKSDNGIVLPGNNEKMDEQD